MERFLTNDSFLNYLILVFCIILIAFIVHRILRAILRKVIEKSEDGVINVTTHFKFFSNAIGLIIFIIALIAIFYIIPDLRSFGISLFAGAGIIAAFIGFASQAALSNIISGLFIVIFKPFRVSDIIQVGTGYRGVVEDITLRHTVIKDFENRRLIIPNSIISSEVILNSTINDMRINNHFLVGISYDSDIDLAIKIIREEAMNHPFFLDNRDEESIKEKKESVLIRIVNFGESSIDLRADIWTSDPTEGFNLKCDLRKSIKARFDQEGIEIPFPHRTIVYKNKP